MKEALQKKTKAAPQRNAEVRGLHRTPSTDSPADRVAVLQRTVGNQAVQRLVESGMLQASLTIGRPNDPYEQEADRVADLVMRMPDTALDSRRSIVEETHSTVRRKPGCPVAMGPAGGEKEVFRRNPAALMITPLIQPKGDASKVPLLLLSAESAITSLRGAGTPLPPSERSFFEPRFGADLSNVQIHSGSQAAELTQSLQARAFTVGRDIVFGSGQYSPGTFDGRTLLAHELTHVVQQTGPASRLSMMPEGDDTRGDVDLRSTAAGELLPPAAHAADNQACFRREINAFHRSRSRESRTMSSIRPWKGIGTVGKQHPMPDIQRQDKLETDLGAAAGLTCPISTEKLNHQNASLDITFDLGGSALTAEDITNIAVFVNNWHGASVSVPVRIHGYASKDGAPKLNWPLSCQRADAVSAQMQKVQPAVALSTGHGFPAGSPGIPAGFINTFAHGETEEFSKTALPPNRRATVHVPSLPSLPAKVAKSPTAKLKSGPTYTPNGTVKATATALKKSAEFRMSAEFEHDPPNAVLSPCGEIRQYIRWSSNDVDPARFRHEGFFTDKTYLPDTWYEDRSQRNIRYGHRRGPHFFNGGAGNQYLDAKGKQDFLNGPVYQGRDRPNTAGSAAYIASFVGSWEFRLDAIDICNGNKVLGSDTVTVQW